MRTCPHPGCGWRPVAPSDDAARDQLAGHLVAEHGREVDVDLPEGTVQVRNGEDDDWETVQRGAVDDDSG